VLSASGRPRAPPAVTKMPIFVAIDRADSGTVMPRLPLLTVVALLIADYCFAQDYSPDPTPIPDRRYSIGERELEPQP
jgi:hypothetical protein